jgi:hypothetical protein
MGVTGLHFAARNLQHFAALFVKFPIHFLAYSSAILHNFTRTTTHHQLPIILWGSITKKAVITRHSGHTQRIIPPPAARARSLQLSENIS